MNYIIEKIPEKTLLLLVPLLCFFGDIFGVVESYSLFSNPAFIDPVINKAMEGQEDTP